MQKNKKTAFLLWGVAFVWFTTHFGGGFASGAQIYSYYVRFGHWCLFMPVIAMLYNALFFAYSLHFAKKHEVYDYRSYNNAFYGKFAPIFSNLFEVLYICVMCVAPAVAFATGGATLSTLTGLPYLLCTFLIGIFIFVVAIFGTDLVRRVASVLSVCIIVGLLIVYIPNILSGTGEISHALETMKASNPSFGKALYSAFIYGTFQLANIAVFVQHAKSFEKPGDAVKSMGIGFIINAFLIILGSVSTAVNMVAAMVRRICSSFGRQSNALSKPASREIIVALLCCIVDFGIAQFGLLTLIQKAYGILAYLAIPVILIPYIIHMIVTRFDTKS